MVVALEMMFNQLKSEFELLKAQNLELIDRCTLQGQQIVEMKDKYDVILTDIRILKEGGNL